MECAICLEEGKLIKFNHKKECGNIQVHDSCLTNWFLANDNECVICRTNLINDYELLSSEEESFNNLNTEQINNINWIKMIIYFKKILFILILLLIIFYFLYFYTKNN